MHVQHDCSKIFIYLVSAALSVHTLRVDLPQCMHLSLTRTACISCELQPLTFTPSWRQYSEMLLYCRRCDTAAHEESAWIHKQTRGTNKVILHAGGMLADATLPKQSLSCIRQVFAAKVDAAQHAHTHTACEPVTSTVLFSSVAALLGSAGQANYSAANGALDGLAAQWSAEGRSVSSVQWGPWAGKSHLHDCFKSGLISALKGHGACEEAEENFTCFSQPENVMLLHTHTTSVSYVMVV